jgi:hypothetical protein
MNTRKVVAALTAPLVIPSVHFLIRKMFEHSPPTGNAEPVVGSDIIREAIVVYPIECVAVFVIGLVLGLLLKETWGFNARNVFAAFGLSLVLLGVFAALSGFPLAGAMGLGVTSLGVVSFYVLVSGLSWAGKEELFSR